MCLTKRNTSLHIKKKNKQKTPLFSHNFKINLTKTQQPSPRVHWLRLGWWLQYSLLRRLSSTYLQKENFYFWSTSPSDQQVNMVWIRRCSQRKDQAPTVYSELHHHPSPTSTCKAKLTQQTVRNQHNGRDLKNNVQPGFLAKEVLDRSVEQLCKKSFSIDWKKKTYCETNGLGVQKGGFYPWMLWLLAKRHFWLCLSLTR